MKVPLPWESFPSSGLDSKKALEELGKLLHLYLSYNLKGIAFLPISQVSPVNPGGHSHRKFTGST